MMSGVIMTCMSDMRPGLVGSIATADVCTYVQYTCVFTGIGNILLDGKARCLEQLEK